MAVYKALNNTTYTTKVETTVTIDSNFTNPYRNVVISSPFASCGAVGTDISKSSAGVDFGYEQVTSGSPQQLKALAYTNISQRVLNSSIEAGGNIYYGTTAGSFGYIVYLGSNQSFVQEYPAGKFTVTRITPEGAILTAEYSIDAGSIEFTPSSSTIATAYFNVYKGASDLILAIKFEPTSDAESEVIE